MFYFLLLRGLYIWCLLRSINCYLLIHHAWSADSTLVAENKSVDSKFIIDFISYSCLIIIEITIYCYRYSNHCHCCFYCYSYCFGLDLSKFGFSFEVVGCEELSAGFDFTKEQNWFHLDNFVRHLGFIAYLDPISFLLAFRMAIEAITTLKIVSIASSSSLVIHLSLEMGICQQESLILNRLY